MVRTSPTRGISVWMFLPISAGSTSMWMEGIRRWISSGERIARSAARVPIMMRRSDFARALLANPSIVILDEATSSIDTESEKLIQNAIQTLLKNRTSFVVAHRLSTIVDADKIIVLDKGKIKEMGTHHELMNKKGAYYELFTSQALQEKQKAFIQ